MTEMIDMMTSRMETATKLMRKQPSSGGPRGDLLESLYEGGCEGVGAGTLTLCVSATDAAAGGGCDHDGVDDAEAATGAGTCSDAADSGAATSSN